jgi:hypothetical protein
MIMHRPSKTFVKRLLFRVVTTTMVFAGTSLFLGEVLHMEWGTRRGVLLNIVTIFYWSSLYRWLHQKPRNDDPGEVPTDPGEGGG